MFTRGDTNTDNTIDISDAVFTLAYLFAGGNPPKCMDSGDANDDGSIDISDAVAILSYLFGGSGPLPAPSPECGSDPTLDELDCAISICED